ncbi:MAG: glycosyl hydrolase family 28-related protein [Solirubrobacteraceae bacterium]
MCRRVILGGVAALALALAAPGVASAASPAPRFGPNVVVFSPSMPQDQIQSTLNTIATQQVPNQFGTQRYAIFFEPGTYGSADNPLIFQVGYYTQVAGLGAHPGDVTINGAVDVFNQCPSGGGPCEGLNNFWRSLSNLTLDVTLPKAPPAYVPATGEDPGCNNLFEYWAVSQAAPMRRVIMNETPKQQVSLQDFCNQGFVSGGFFADDEFNGGAVINAGQQQFFTRNSNVNNNWTNGVWNQVFLGDNGAPATIFAPGTNQYTTLPSTPVSQSEPFLYTDSSGNYSVFVPAVQHDSVGPSYAGATSEAGRSIPIQRFFIANPSTPLWAINAALAVGQNLILTPGVYDLRAPIVVAHPGTVVMGLGFATLIPQDGNVAMETANAPGIKLSGMIFDAGPRNSPALLVVGGRRVGWWRAGGDPGPGTPTLVQDVFFRVGGAEPGQARTALVVNTDDTILDDVWAWRADHGAGVGWTSNRSDTGLIVNGDDVDAYGLFVEHFQKFEVIWNGQRGEDVFFQNEMPYDPPSQSAWMSSPSTDGYAAFLLTPRVKSFQGYGMGSYSFFNQGIPIFATQAFQAPPDQPGDQFHDLLTIFLDAVHGSGGINSVINGVGGSSTAANADTPVDVVGYP